MEGKHCFSFTLYEMHLSFKKKKPLNKKQRFFDNNEQVLWKDKSFTHLTFCPMDDSFLNSKENSQTTEAIKNLIDTSIKASISEKKVTVTMYQLALRKLVHTHMR